MPKVMLITVGTGRDHADIAKAIVRSIEIQNPDRVVLLATPGSMKTACYVREFSGLTHEKCKIEEHGFENEVNKLYEFYDNIFGRLVKEGYGIDDIVIDFTSGTKPMSAAIFAVGISREVKNICYVSGERDSQGRVMPGTERPEVPSLNTLYLRIKLGRLPELFGTYQFEACLRLIGEFEAKIGHPDILDKLGFLRSLVEGYMLWDRFQLRCAFEVLTRLKKHYREHVEAAGVKEALARHVGILSIECGEREDLAAKTQNGVYCRERLVDLYANSQRRFSEGKYDDATSRAYRALEYLAQLALYEKYGLESGDLKIESIRDRLPGEKVAELEERRRRSRNEGRVELGLVECYDLLKALGDPIGIRFMNEYGDKRSSLFKYYSLRNKSINAHGFEPVGKEGCEGFMGVLEGYLTAYFPRWRELYSGMEFPRLPGVDFWS